MDHAEKIARLRLIRTKRLGPVTFTALLRRFGNGVDALAAIPELNRLSATPLKIATPQQVEEEINAAQSAGADIYVKGEDGYPDAFMRFDDTPGCLTVKGHPHLLQKDSIAMVGSRNASANAQTLAEMLAQQISSRGFVITSGMARGIDAAAHRGALNNGTVAVLAGGINAIYPKENTKLYEMIVDLGVVISEMPFGTEPSSRMFPIRNRLISALSLGVVVVEANLGSGSLITASDAADRGLEVMAIPGSPLDPRAQGCNNLIRDGANLVQTADDIVDLLQRHQFQAKGYFDLKKTTQKQPLQTPEALLEAEKIFTQHLSFTPTEVDELISQCHLSASTVQSALLKMELDGSIKRVFGNRVYRVFSDDRPLDL